MAQRNKALTLLKGLGIFLLDSIQRTVGAKTNGEMVSKTLDLASAFILLREQEDIDNGVKSPGHVKLMDVASQLVKAIGAQGMELGLASAIGLVSTQFIKLNEKLLKEGKEPLAKSTAPKDSGEIPPEKNKNKKMSYSASHLKYQTEITSDKKNKSLTFADSKVDAVAISVKKIDKNHSKVTLQPGPGKPVLLNEEKPMTKAEAEEWEDSEIPL